MNFSELNFNPDQQEAVVFSFFHIAKDEEVELSKVKSIINTVAGRAQASLDSLKESEGIFKNASAQISILKSFNAKQKEWFIQKSLGLVKSRDSVKKNEFSIANGFFRAMGMRREEIIKMIRA